MSPTPADFGRAAAAADRPRRAPVSRLRGVPGIGVDRMGDQADVLADPAVLRLENLDTDLRPPAAALEATRRAVDEDGANSYLPFLGADALRRTAAAHVGALAGLEYDWRRSCLISAGGLSGILTTLLALLEPGDPVVTTDPIYVGLLNRIRIAGGAPVLVPYRHERSGWRLDVDALHAARRAPAARRPDDEPVDAERRRPDRERNGRLWRTSAARRTPGSCTTPPWSASSTTARRISIPRRSPAWPSARSRSARYRRSSE